MANETNPPIPEPQGDPLDALLRSAQWPEAGSDRLDAILRSAAWPQMSSDGLTELLAQAEWPWRPSSVERLRQLAGQDSVPAPVPEQCASPLPPALPTWGTLGGWTIWAPSILIAIVAAAFYFSGFGRAPTTVTRQPSAADFAGDDGTPLPAISSMHFDSGTAQMTLDRIGTVVIEGPADFKLVGPLRAQLTRGSIKVRVTEETGHGFTVETPYGKVTDLGTEFGLRVTDKGSAGVVERV
jgi:hypothetical protein